MSPDLSPLKRRIIGAGERFAGRFLTDGLVCVSRDESTHARELGIPEDRLSMIVNGIDATGDAGLLRRRQRWRRELGLGMDDVCVGFVGRLAYQKAPQRVLEAVALAGRSSAGHRLRCVIVGDGEDSALVDRTIVTGGLAETVTRICSDQAREIMPAFDIFTMPSRYEAMPYVLLEALDAGLPVVATDVGGVSICVENERNGFVIPQDQNVVEGLAAAYGRLIADKELRQRFAARSREKRVEFDLDTMAERTVALYRDVLGRGKVRFRK